VLFSIGLYGLYLKAAIDYHNRSPLEVIYGGVAIDLGEGEALK